MVLYTLKEGKFYDIHTFKPDLSDLKENGFPNKIYINFTNRCPCACSFCLRSLKEFEGDDTMWLEEEPTLEEIKQEFRSVDWGGVDEIVFCGFGEPTMRLFDLTELGRWLKEQHPSVPVRVNTNGLSDLVYGKPTAPFFTGVVDKVSVSLNASDAEKFLDITRNPFGLKSYRAMLDFAAACKEVVPEVVMTVVDVIGEEEVAACKKVCEENGLVLRVRPYEES